MSKALLESVCFHIHLERDKAKREEDRKRRLTDALNQQGSEKGVQ
jgi:hypothetical protein